MHEMGIIIFISIHDKEIETHSEKELATGPAATTL